MRRVDAGAHERVAHDRPNTVTAGLQAADWRHRAQEEVPILGRRPAALEIGSDGPAHVDRHRQQAEPAALAAYSKLTSIPVAVVELQRDDLAGPQPQAR